MKIHFKIQFHTKWGERLRLCGDVPALGKMNEDKALDMTLISPESGIWEAKIEVRRKIPFVFPYRYFLEEEKSGTRTYECADRELKIGNEGCTSVELIDSWRSAPKADNTLFSTAFTDALLKPAKTKKAKFTSFANQKKNDYIVRFQIHVARIEPNHRIGITGGSEIMGNWDPAKGVMLSNEDHPKWRGEVTMNAKDLPLYYKYFIYDDNTGKVLFLEDGPDRFFNLKEIEPKKKLIIRGDERFSFPRYPWKGAGVSIPVFSLRRKEGYGVGEFTDLKGLVDWAKKTGQKLLQILPINDTVATHTWVDSYPYSAISVYALHPIYANIEKMGKLKSATANRIVKERGQHLNENKEIDYEGAMRLKARYFKMLYDEQKEKFLAKKDFVAFFEKNGYWLKPYAAFSYLRDLFNTPNFNKWGKYKNYDKKLIDEITSPDSDHYDDIAIHYFIQYHLHKQLLEAANYARKNGIILKGDIPIGIYRYSVDAWQQPELYHMDKQAGAPPDDFSFKGQNWGFPTYNWEEMAKDGFQWWKNRLQKLSEYFDSFRIDHILGFFRIWEIPYDHVEGVMGYFNPSMAYHRDELGARGIYLDEDRMCKPYIREHFLEQRFGHLTQEAKGRYLDHLGNGYYQLKEEVNTQRKIKNLLDPQEADDSETKIYKEKLRDGLMSLASEVLFIPNPHDSEGNSFFPRSTMQYTSSFRELDEGLQHTIHQVYLDYFYHRNEEYWKQQAYHKLPAIKQATNMLICGEDLGMVPTSVPEVMSNLGILSLEIQRMPKDPKKEFNHPNEYPYLSVASPSSHDMPTIRGWWEEDTSRSQRFFNTILGNEGNSPFFCEPWIAKQILDQHYYSPSMWTIIPLQDLFAADGNVRRENPQEERINVPSNPKNYWRYRMHLSVEEMLELNDFNDMVLQLVKDSGRYYAY